MNSAPKAPWILCWLMFGATALSFLDRQVLSVLAPQLMAELSMNNTVYSRVVSAFVFSYTIMCAAGGWFVDRLGTRRGLALSVGVWSLASAAHSLATGPWSLGAARMLLGFGEGGNEGTLSAPPLAGRSRRRPADHPRQAARDIGDSTAM